MEWGDSAAPTAIFARESHPLSQKQPRLGNINDRPGHFDARAGSSMPQSLQAGRTRLFRWRDLEQVRVFHRGVADVVDLYRTVGPPPHPLRHAADLLQQRVSVLVPGLELVGDLRPDPAPGRVG